MTLHAELVLRFEEAVREETQALQTTYDRQTAEAHGNYQKAVVRVQRLRAAIIEALARLEGEEA